MVLNVCSNPEFLEVILIVKQLINIIKVATPIVFIIMSMVDVVRAVTASNQEQISSKARQILPRLFAAAMVFLVPTIFEVLLVAIDEQIEFASCITNAEPAMIKELYIDRADTYVVLAENTLEEFDLNQARLAVSSLTDNDLKELYTERLDKVAEIIYYVADDDNSSDSDGSGGTPNPDYKKLNFPSSKGNVSDNKKFPYYNQCDSRWKKVTLNSGAIYNTCNSGCGYTAIAMAFAGLNKDVTITPINVIPYVRTFSNNVGAITDAALVSSKITSKYGITPRTVFKRGTSISTDEKKNKIVSELRKNRPVVLLIPGHYILLSEIKGNKITVLDPGRTANNGKYTIDEVYNKYKNYKNRCTDKGKCGFVYAVSYGK